MFNKNNAMFFENSFASATAGEEIGASHLDNEKQTISISLVKCKFSCILNK